MVNKLLSLGEQTISEIKYMSNLLSLNESTVTKIAIGILYNKIQNGVDITFRDLLKDD
jgi:hypothetical protein